MKKRFRFFAAVMAAFTIIASSATAVGAAQTKSVGKIITINCGSQSCKNIEALLSKTCNSCKVTVKSTKGYCPTGNCSTKKPAQSSKPAAIPPAKSEPQAAGYNDAYEAEVLRLINIERGNKGLAPLSIDSGAAKVARLRAKEIVKSFSHTRPDGSSCFTAAKELGVSYRTAGENIAYGYSTPEQVVKGWMNSEGHRKNILSKSFGKIGIGCYKSGSTLYWSQFFIG